MMFIKRIVPLILIACAASIGACASEDPSTGPTVVREAAAQDYGTFTNALRAGADCPELYEIRNAIDPASPNIDAINDDLRSIGCFSSSSTRTSTEEADQDAESTIVPSFTVREYRMYRAVVDTPFSVSEDQALRNVAQQYGASPEDVKAAADKVQEMLFENDWFGTPQSEIRRASDWQGEQP